ncbi:hypothetical protein BH24PSE2_BH24PSE2_01080 [soil metagenome]
MMKMLPLFAAALACGVLADRLLLSPDGRDGDSAPTAAAPAPSGLRIELNDAIAELEALAGVINAEVAERRHLEERLNTLSARLDALHEEPGGPQPEATGDRAGAARAPSPEAQSDGTLSALIAAGIAEPEAREIKGRMDALDLEMMNLQYAATQEGWSGSQRFADAMRANQKQRQSVRETIGDDAYDRYLYAMGQPNRIAVQDVLEGSAAARAGLEAGDVLLSYGGQRLFTARELIEQSRTGSADQSVTIEVIRNGRRMQIYLPRGPLGIRAGMHRTAPDDTPS